MGPLRHALVCASNVNRSMAAHELLKKEGLDAESYGVGNSVKLPGPSPSQPNRYSFGTPYRDIYEDLQQKDAQLYANNGLLEMIKRDVGVKLAPQRWQDRPRDAPRLDVVVTFERKVMEILVEDMQRKDAACGGGGHPCLVVNMDVRDSTADATSAAPDALLLCQLLEESDDWESEIGSILLQFERKTGRKRPQYHVCFL